MTGVLGTETSVSKMSENMVWIKYVLDLDAKNQRGKISLNYLLYDKIFII